MIRVPLAVFLVVLTLLLGGPRAFAANPDKAGIEFFEKKIRPVLARECYECHSEKSKILKANMLLDTRDGTLRGGDSGAALAPGKSDESLLMAALRYDGLEMPPKGKLSEDVIADFAKWIDMGAPDPRSGKASAPKAIDIAEGRKFWSFQPPQLSSLPEVKQKNWPKSDIDHYVLAGMEAKGLRPAPDADRETLIRRLSFDLTGLPPTPEETQAFVKDQSDQALETLVDRLMASPRFGERWGRHWLDVARYAESSGKERNVPYRMAWRYRDYVIDAFNADMPYDQFIREQLAGDLLPHASTDERDRQLIATGFLAIGPRALTERVNEQYLLDVCDEQLDTTCRAFLASTAGCARCHDHKFDPIPTTDYYALIGIFRSTDHQAGVINLRREFSYNRAAVLGDEAIRDGAAKALQGEIARLEKELDVCRNDARAANKAKDKDKQRECKEREDATLARLTEARSRAELDDRSGPRFAMAVCDGTKPVDYAVRIRGELEDLGPVVPRGFITVATSEHTPTVDPSRSGRLELANWIASRDNPLTSRVMVNRLWQHLFGKGIVDSVDNFGVLGEKPSHPELLDYLAIRFVDEDWSVKRMLRLIVLSRVYQLSSQRDDTAYTVDPGNRLLWRFARRRLEAEAIRDSILSVCGQLSLERPYGSPTLTIPNVELGSTSRSLAMNDSFTCRGVYLPMLRGNVPEMLGLFDMADPSLVIGQREVTTVATQALYLMNSKFIMDKSKRFADRLLAEKDLDDAGRIELAYRLALTRGPSKAELEQVLAFVGDVDSASTTDSKARPNRWADFCQALFSSAEFLYVR